jgi:hypothetical protein
MNIISLRPYHGKIILCKSPDEMKKIYKKYTKQNCSENIYKNGGKVIRLEGDSHEDITWLVYASKKPYLAHEFSHVLLHTFDLIGHDPRKGDGEPFCYMLSQLMIDAS